MAKIDTLLETTECLCLASRRAARNITRRFDHALRPKGLRATQFALLSALHLAGPKAIGELADLLGIQRTTLTRSLSLAERRGLATINRDSADARMRLATITGRGTKKLESAMNAWRLVQSELTESMGAHAAISLRILAGGPCTANVFRGRERSCLYGNDVSKNF